MSGRKKIEVNEEALRQMMANDKQTYLIGDSTEKEVEKEPELVISPKSVFPENTVVEEVSNNVSNETSSEETKVEIHNPENDTGKAVKKRKTQKHDFSELYLKERIIKNRRQIYISAETYDIIKGYLKFISDVSLIAYLDNILLQHIEEHKDTISELFDRKVKPF